jgi:hypothetical protein
MSTAHVPQQQKENAVRQLGVIASLREHLDAHFFFWMNLLIALYVLFLPQIKNIMCQPPPLADGFWGMFRYALFLAFIIGFYALSVFAVVRQFPWQSVQDRVDKWVKGKMDRWEALGPGRYYNVGFWFAVFTWRSPDLCSRWLVWTVSVSPVSEDPKELGTTVDSADAEPTAASATGAVVVRQKKTDTVGAKARPKAALTMALIVGVAVTALAFGTHADTSRLYPLAGAFCQTTALYSLAAFVWLCVAIRARGAGADHPGEVSTYLGRFIAWLISTSLVGELLWALAATNCADNTFSYRLYTIWAVFQLLTMLVIVGLLIDQLHISLKPWPVRQFSFIVLIPLGVGLFSHSAPVDASDLNRHLKPDQAAEWKRVYNSDQGPKTMEWHNQKMAWFKLTDDSLKSLRGAGVPEEVLAKLNSLKDKEHPMRKQFLRELEEMLAKNDLERYQDDILKHALLGPWFDHLSNRIKAVESGPVVIVAASGGGSRAAIFTSLVLETLARPSLSQESDPPHPQQSTKPTWMDNVVLISSVSGGSLATAYHVAARVDGRSLVLDKDLLNSSDQELKYRGVKHAGELIQQFLDQPPDGWDQAVKDQPAGGLSEEAFNPYYNLRDQGKDGKQQAAKALVTDKAVEVLQKAKVPLQKALDRESTKRKEKEEERSKLAKKAGAKREDRDELDKEIVNLNDRVGALRTALALEEAYEALAKPGQNMLGGWLWTSRAFDEMCVDFMAPIMRGAMAPHLGRGNALARFWTDRFDWYNCSNVTGYHGAIGKPDYDARTPAVLFNAVDVARGSRLAVGFPPLPLELWAPVYSRGATREVPRAVNAPVSLARAVRMSSNFPYGFRAMEINLPKQETVAWYFDRQTPAAEKSAPNDSFERIHVLDGGIVDNTGLDTLYELFLALEYHADEKNLAKDKPRAVAYHQKAKALLGDLRKRDVCILEIDAGAKPYTKLPCSLNPLGGVLEAGQALENGSYSNADRAKQLYVKEIRRILGRRLAAPADLPEDLTSYAKALEEDLPPTALHYCIQCNHYQPGHSVDPAIMTAWSLGPKDKAEVVARFLPELKLWTQRQIQLWDDLKASRVEIERRQQVLTLLGRVARLSGKAKTLAAAFDKFVASKPRTADQAAMAELSKLRRDLDALKKQRDKVNDPIKKAEDNTLAAVSEGVKELLGECEKMVSGLEKAKNSPEDFNKVVIEYEGMGKLVKDCAQLDPLLRKAGQNAVDEMKGRIRFDPQIKYDQANRQQKQSFEKRATPAQ